MPEKPGGVRIILSSALTVTVDGRRAREPAFLKRLHGLAEPDEPLVQYFDDELAKLGLGAGFLRCVFDREKGEARIVTEYDAPRRLTKRELHLVKEDAHGQWLDGVGESFFDDFCEAYDCSVDIASRINVVQEPGRAWKPSKTAKKRPMPRPKGRGPAPARGDDKKALARKLHAASSATQVRALLQAGANANAADEDGYQPLHLPALLRQTAAVQLLVDHGSNVNGVITGSLETPLMMAASYGLLKTVRLLLSAGAAVHQTDAFGNTALARAVVGVLAQDIKPSPAVIQELLTAGARLLPNVLTAAAGESSPKIVQMLLDAGAAVNASTGGKWTALSSAVYMSNANVVRLLLRVGADPNCMVYQQTALAAASQRGNTAIVKLLKSAGAK